MTKPNWKQYKMKQMIKQEQKNTDTPNNTKIKTHKIDNKMITWVFTIH